MHVDDVACEHGERYKKSEVAGGITLLRGACQDSKGGTGPRMVGAQATVLNGDGVARGVMKCDWRFLMLQFAARCYVNQNISRGNVFTRVH